MSRMGAGTGGKAVPPGGPGSGVALGDGPGNAGVPEGSRPGRRWARVALGMLAVAAAVALPLAGWIASPLPPEMASPPPVPSLHLQDRHGLPLRSTRAGEGSRGGWIGFDEIDPDLLRAFLAAEDDRFFQHAGIDLRAVARAARSNLSAGRVVSGASTITMQVARLLRPIPRNWRGKIAQALWAVRLEAHLEKSRLFEIYLNLLPLGQGAIGVSAASHLYFDAPASELSPGQAALLAALAHAPSLENPLVSAEKAARRKDAVLGRMVREGYLTPAEAERASAEPVLRGHEGSPFHAPHFTGWVLASREGGRGASGTLRTTLDLALQEELEGEVRHAVRMLQRRGVSDGALVVMENRTGDILAWVGSPDFWEERDGQVDMVVSPRQPGSALKPFLYGAAFDRGFTPASVFPDVPRSYATPSGPYSPQNYDRTFHGPVRARQALASSFNVPAVELAHRLGVSAFLDVLREAGFASLDRSAEHYGLGLALGNGEVTLLELANAYRGLANGGVWRPPRALLTGGAEEWADDRRFLSAGAAALVLDILADPVARIPGFGTETPFDFPFPTATKTGTSRHFTDNWAVATTAGFTVAVWVGNFSGQPMGGVSGVSGAGPLLYRAVLRTARRYPAGHLPSPEQAGALPHPVCLLSGMRATPDCASMIEWFLAGTEPLAFDDWQVGGMTVLPAEYAEWEGTQISRDEVRVAARSEGRGGSEEAILPYSILSPRDGDRYSVPPGTEGRYATIPLTAVGTAPDEAAEWFVDGERIRSARWTLVPGEHRFQVRWASGHEAVARIVVEGEAR